MIRLRFDRAGFSLEPIINGMRGYDLTRFVDSVTPFEKDMLVTDLLWYGVYSLAKRYFDIDPPVGLPMPIVRFVSHSFFF